MTFDFSPFYRSTVGFDRLFDIAGRIANVEAAGWPPYNIERIADDEYRITMAVAGFCANEIELVQNDATLLVTGKKAQPEAGQTFLHQGIAVRPFKQSFDLADHVKVTGADLKDGLLTIDLVREVPEALKPRKIAIGGGEAGVQRLTRKAA